RLWANPLELLRPRRAPGRTPNAWGEWLPRQLYSRVTYAIKEIYYTLQGEGANAGSPAVLLRFSGCNLSAGREQDRSAAACQFCDPEFQGPAGPTGGKSPTAKALADQVAAVFPLDAKRFQPWVICTGGEPLLQLDDPLLAALIERGFRVAIETNGTI